MSESGASKKHSLPPNPQGDRLWDIELRAHERDDELLIDLIYEVRLLQEQLAEKDR